ncbi:hypothetical protein M0R88_01260 [Halorussus gelatinilyticus]|uniref:Uncharacterized protein n=1 Tax=Halorussus gelatinilyticus TaxID=2937524 RepID=A0A8U0IJ86_9EURY|nr:hypothetical protein [Halorussus gelatinilyticus]UPW00745.1 hypothetical protein M0R88_01260 [Halorussus gelatinilyticus]
MAYGHDQRDRPATGEGTTEGSVAESDAAPSDSAASGDEESADGTPPELRWVQLREPRHALEIGRDGRIVASEYHESRDTWEVLLETYGDE